MLARGAISWKGKLSMLHPLCKLNLRNFILGPRIVNSISKPLRIYCDNSVAVFFSKNNKYSNSAKHIELKYLTVKEEVRKQRVSIEHISTQLMIANPLIKGLPPKTFKD